MCRKKGLRDKQQEIHEKICYLISRCSAKLRQHSFTVMGTRGRGWGIIFERRANARKKHLVSSIQRLGEVGEVTRDINFKTQSYPTTREMLRPPKAHLLFEEHVRWTGLRNQTALWLPLKFSFPEFDSEIAFCLVSGKFCL